MVNNIKRIDVFLSTLICIGATILISKISEFSELALIWVYIMCALITMAMTVQHYMLYYKNIITFNSTRKNYYITSLACIFLYAVIIIAISLIICKIIGIIFFDSLYKILWLFLLTIFAGFLGELVGIMFTKSRISGIIAFAFLLILAIFTVVFSMFEKCPSCGNWHVLRSANTDWLVGNNIFIIICIAGSIVLAIVNWLLVSKSEIKV
jgi:hypothetical protein